MSIPESEWVWCGFAGHFGASDACRFHLNTRVGNYRISTVGDYHPHDEAEPQPIGVGRLYETYVFHVRGIGEGRVTRWNEIEADSYNDAETAEAGHLAMCRKYAEAER